ncbi:hypothetical protein SUDANB176_06955 [Streptomyces sp. enrichment culture]
MRGRNGDRGTEGIQDPGRRKAAGDPRIAATDEVPAVSYARYGGHRTGRTGPGDRRSGGGREASAQTVSSAAPKDTSKRSHQMVTLLKSAGSTSAGSG